MSDDAQTPAKKRSWKQWLAMIGGGLLIAFLLVLGGFRLVGSGSYEGSVIRAYEKMGEYRVELQLDDGSVRVFTNQEMRWPYVKFDTADLQAELEASARRGERVSVQAYGFRNRMFSWFPNVVSMAVLLSGEEVRAQRAAAWAPQITRALQAKGMLTGDEAQANQVITQALIEAQATRTPLGAP